MPMRKSEIEKLNRELAQIEQKISELREQLEQLNLQLSGLLELARGALGVPIGGGFGLESLLYSDYIRKAVGYMIELAGSSIYGSNACGLIHTYPLESKYPRNFTLEFSRYSHNSPAELIFALELKDVKNPTYQEKLRMMITRGRYVIYTAILKPEPGIYPIYPAILAFSESGFATTAMPHQLAQIARNGAGVRVVRDIPLLICARDGSDLKLVFDADVEPELKGIIIGNVWDLI